MRFPIRLFAICLAFGLAAWGCSGSSAPPDAGLDGDGYDGDSDGPDGDEVNTDGDEQVEDEGPVELTVQAVLPSRGPIEGGTWANVVGSGFVEGIGDSPFDVRDVTDVTFGDNFAIDIEVIRDDMISVRTPPGVAGTTEVAVENPNGRYVLEDAFTYYDTVTARSVEPADLSCPGGTGLLVEGTGFSSDTIVIVGGRPCSDVQVENDTTVSALAPPGLPGDADVEIVNRNGQALLFRAVTYHPLPVLESIDPAAGPPQGGTPVTVEGAGFEEETGLLFASDPASNVAFLSETILEALTPPGPVGSVDLVAQGPLDSAVLPGGFVYLPEAQGVLTVTAVAPSCGPVDGGNRVTLVGEEFGAGIDQVLFGENDATDLVPIDDRTLGLTVPANEAGAVAVTVRSGVDEASLIDAYRYFSPLGLTTISPESGPASGGTTLNLQGDGFHAAVEVLVGGVPAQQVTFVDSGEITAVTPPGPPGHVDITVRDNDTQATLPAAFEYTTDISLLRVEPDTGSRAGGTYVTCYGSGFDGGTRIYFGDQEGNIVQVVSSSVLTARTPSGDAGEVTVVIEKGEEHFDLQAGFTYFDPTNDRGGASGGPMQGSLNITALDGSYSNYGGPVPGATVLIDQPAISGFTDDRGQVTFSGPSMVRAVTVTVAKEGFEAVTVANFNAANLTVYLYPNEREPVVTQPGDLKTADLSGRVFGFKDIPGLPSGPTTTMQARVSLTSYSIYSVPPYGGIPTGQVIENDGDSYEYTLRLGNYSVYALFGSYDSSEDIFTPALLGLRRNISLINEEPVENQDIVLSTYLDKTVAVHLQDPPLGDGETEAKYSAYVSLDLGWDGIVYLSQDHSQGTELLLKGLPAAASDSFIFTGLASLGGGYPYSYIFRRQEGDIGDGVTLGPFLGFTEIVDPPQDGEMEGGRIAWSIEGPRPELIEILIETNELIPNLLWRVILPGDTSEIILPEELLGLLPQGEPLILLVYTANSPRFSFDRFNYSQLSTSRWTAYTTNFAVFRVP